MDKRIIIRSFLIVLAFGVILFIMTACGGNSNPNKTCPNPNGGSEIECAGTSDDYECCNGCMLSKGSIDSEGNIGSEECCTGSGSEQRYNPKEACCDQGLLGCRSPKECQAVYNPDGSKKEMACGKPCTGGCDSHATCQDGDCICDQGYSQCGSNPVTCYTSSQCCNKETGAVTNKGLIFGRSCDCNPPCPEGEECDTESGECKSCCPDGCSDGAYCTCGDNGGCLNCCGVPPDSGLPAADLIQLASSCAKYNKAYSQCELPCQWHTSDSCEEVG